MIVCNVIWVEGSYMSLCHACHSLQSVFSLLFTAGHILCGPWYSVVMLLAGYCMDTENNAPFLVLLYMQSWRNDMCKAKPWQHAH